MVSFVRANRLLRRLAHHLLRFLRRIPFDSQLSTVHPGAEGGENWERLAIGSVVEALIAAIHRDWGEAQGNYDELRFFAGLRPSEQIALLVTDFDPEKTTLTIDKARVAGIDKDSTKTGEARRV